MIEEAHRQVKATNNYGKEDDLITDCFKRFPTNTDVTIVAMKVGLIDITNSTHVSQHKSLISAVELAECIVEIKDIDNRIKNGDPEVVNEIARSMVILIYSLLQQSIVVTTIRIYMVEMIIRF